MPHISVVICEGCGRRREESKEGPWRGCFCGSDDFSVEFEFIRYYDYADDPDAYFLLPEAADLLEMDEKRVLELCEKGAP